MSKAFTRESDDAPDEPVRTRHPSLLPLGAKNYLTRDGARLLREELERLIQVERPRLLPTADATEGRRQLQELDQRILHLQQSLHSAVVVAPPVTPEDRVRFGATVTVREHSGSTASYRIVGVDEVDLDRGWVSWLSPIARALLNARVGGRVHVKLPSGVQDLEVVAISYE